MLNGTAYITNNNSVSYHPYDVTRPITLNFDLSAPPVLLPEGVFTPLSQHNTVYHYRALWALLLPSTGGVIPAPLLRGYIAQRLIWELGDHAAVFPPNALNSAVFPPNALNSAVFPPNTLKSAHLPSANMSRYTDRDIDNLQIVVSNLLVALSEWVCPRRYAFYKCVVSLSQFLVHKSFVGSEFLNLTSAWLNHLHDLGYEEPMREIQLDNGTLVDLKTKRLNTLKQGSPVQFVPVEQECPVFNNTRLHDRSSLYSQVMSICSKIPLFTLGNVSKTVPVSKHIHSDLLLIIVFNFNDWYEENIKVLEVIYRKMFPNMIYCGSSSKKFLAATSKYNRNFSYIEAPIYYGYFGYMCAMKAIEMRYGVSGYLMVADDMIVSTWKIPQLDSSKIWYVPQVRLNCDTGKSGWRWWRRRCGRAALYAALISLKNLKQSQYESGVLEPNVFLDNLKVNNKLQCYFAIADIIHIPKTFENDLHYYFRQFAKYSSFQEIAVPMILRGVANKSEVWTLQGEYLWKARRKIGWQKFYSPENDFFIHPVKLSQPNSLAEICHHYFIELLHRTNR